MSSSLHAAEEGGDKYAVDRETKSSDPVADFRCLGESFGVQWRIPRPISGGGPGAVQVVEPVAPCLIKITCCSPTTVAERSDEDIACWVRSKVGSPIVPVVYEDWKMKMQLFDWKNQYLK